MKIKFSIIIPVYNVQDRLERCINSVLNQHCQEIEVIIINDGSTDDSYSICKRFEEKYNFITIINQKNRGLAAARNKGIDLAKGEYIVFLDSDDYLVPDKLNKIYVELQTRKVELLGTVRKEIDENGKFLGNYYNCSKVEKGKIINGRDYLRTYGCKYSVMVWQYIYKTEFIKQNKLYFFEGIYHEDSEFMTRVFMKVSRVYFSNILFYNYCYFESSIMRRKNIKRCYDLIRVSELINKTAKKIKNDKKIKTHLSRYASYMAWESIHSCIIQGFDFKKFLSSNNNRKKIIRNIKTINKYTSIKVILYLHFDGILKITKYI